jgi:membrane protein YfhO
MSRKESKKERRPERERPHRPEPTWADALERHAFPVTLGALAVLLILFFSPVFFAGKTFEAPDQIASVAHQPFLKDAYASSGTWIQKYPLWTPYIFCGMPSFGSLIAAPYTNPMSFLLSPIHGVVKVITYYLLLGLFTWLYLRRHGLSALASLFGAVAFVFCAHVITLIMFGHNSKIATLVFLPLVLLATDEIWRAPSLRWVAILALAVGTMLVSSHLQIAYYTMFAAAIFLIVATVFAVREHLGWSALLRRWVAWGVGLGLGVAASSVIFLSVREYAAHSIRGGTEGGLSYDYATNWSFHPLEMITWLQPSFMGFGKATYWGWMPFTDFPHYMGILVLVLAAFALTTWPRERGHVYLGVLAGFALLLAFGRHLPLLYKLFFEAMPYFNKFRVPSMMLVLLQFAVACLAAIGLDRVLKAEGEERARLWRRLRKVAVILGAVCALVSVLVLSGGLDRTVSTRMAEKSSMYGVTPDQAPAFAARELALTKSMVLRDAGAVLAVLALGVFLIRARLRGGMTAATVGLGVLLLTVLDLWNVDHRPAHYYPRTRDMHAFQPTPAVTFLKQDPEPYRILPLTGDGLNNNWFAYFRVPSILGYHPAKLQIVQDVIDDNGQVGILKTLRNGNFNVVNILNMKYVVADQELAVGPLVTVFHQDQYVMRNTAVLPRMWFVDRVRVLPDRNQELEALADSTWKPREEALAFASLGTLDPGHEGTALITKYEPREIHATVTSPGNSLLVMSEIYYDAGWHAWLDGTPITIQRVDYLLRGVIVPAGTHELRMRFDPASFRAGITISVLAYAVCLLALVGSFVQRRWVRRTTLRLPPASTTELPKPDTHS